MLDSVIPRICARYPTPDPVLRTPAQGCFALIVVLSLTSPAFAGSHCLEWGWVAPPNSYTTGVGPCVFVATICLIVARMLAPTLNEMRQLGAFLSTLPITFLLHDSLYGREMTPEMLASLPPLAVDQPLILGCLSGFAAIGSIYAGGRKRIRRALLAVAIVLSGFLAYEWAFGGGMWGCVVYDLRPFVPEVVF